MDAFYFRLTINGDLYYTETKTDTTVLGILKPDQLVQAKKGFKSCMEVKGSIGVDGQEGSMDDLQFESRYLSWRVARAAGQIDGSA